MLKKAFILSLFACLFATLSHAQFFMTIDNQTCAQIDVYVVETPMGSCVPMAPVLYNVPPMTIAPMLPISPGFEMTFCRVIEAGTSNFVHINSPSCGVNNAMMAPFLCDGIPHFTDVNFFSPTHYLLTVFP